MEQKPRCVYTFDAGWWLDGIVDSGTEAVWSSLGMMKGFGDLECGVVSHELTSVYQMCRGGGSRNVVTFIGKDCHEPVASTWS